MTLAPWDRVENVLLQRSPSANGGSERYKASEYPLLAPDEQRFELDELSYSLASDIVELVILTTDDSFLRILREAVGSTRRLWHVPSADKVSDLLVAGEVGILVLDEGALLQSAERFVRQIKNQFPDLVIVVAGNRDAEAGLATLISSGVIYRFIHKPMSPGRAKLFADAAVKKYGEQRRRTAGADSSELRQGLPRGTLGIAIALGCAGLIGGYLLWRHSSQADRLDATLSSAPLALPAAESPLVALAAAALAANRLTSPSGDNALELYLQALHRNPLDAQARAGLSEVHERLLARAENALLEERLTEAASAIDIARKAGVDGDRVAFLSAQLLQARERQRALQGATHTTANEARPPADPPEATSAPAAARQQPESAPEQLAKTAEERLQQDRLIEPANDNAKYYILTLRSLDPSNAALVGLIDDLGVRLVAKARRALALEQYDAARSWLDEVAGIGYSSGDSQQVARELEAAVAQPKIRDDVVAASDLKIQNSVQPTYPTAAASAHTEGWVDLEFTVTAEGSVTDIEVRAASPPGVFDAAAIAALRQWTYLPVTNDGKPATQRARISMRFTLAR